MLDRPLFVSADRARELYRRMRRDLEAQHDRHLAELAALRRELDELRTAILARVNAERELAELRRRRTLVEAWSAERDLGQPLQ